MHGSESPWRGRRVLVTGGTEYLGAAVVSELLAHGAEVVGLVGDRTDAAALTRHQLTGRVHLVHGRVDDLFRVHSALAVYEADTVFHLVEADPNRPDRAMATVVEAARRHDPRTPVVTAAPTDWHLDTTAPPAVPLGVARFGDVFGTGDDSTFRTVPAAVRALLAGERPTTPADGPTRDFVFVRDAARACLALGEALAACSKQVIVEATFRSGWTYSARAMAAVVGEAVAGRAVATSPAPANPFGWMPSVSLADALTETIGWYRSHTPARTLGSHPGDAPLRAAA